MPWQKFGRKSRQRPSRPISKSNSSRHCPHSTPLANCVSAAPPTSKIRDNLPVRGFTTVSAAAWRMSSTTMNKGLVPAIQTKPRNAVSSGRLKKSLRASTMRMPIENASSIALRSQRWEWRCWFITPSPMKSNGLTAWQWSNLPIIREGLSTYAPSW